LIFALVDTSRSGRYVPSVVLRLAAAAIGLLFAGCIFYVVTSYIHAFWHRRSTLPLGRLARAAFVELGACLLLLPFWPLWLVIGASYEAAHEGQGTARGTRHPVILLHGFAMNRTNWIWLGRRLAKRGIGPLYGTSYFSPQSVRRSAEQLARFIDGVLAREKCEHVDIVAHSLGGVVARYYIERLGGAAHVGRLVTIGSPHNGTVIARLGALFPSARETLSNSAFYAELGPLSPRENISFTSVWSRADAIIEPPESSSIAPIGEDRVFDDLGHLSLLLSPRVLDAVAERLRA
jgi:triacylglycerol esterase/lipase EstA (alpha/beta hydrolase family)